MSQSPKKQSFLHGAALLAIADTGTERNNVFQRTAQFCTHDIRTCVHTKSFIHKNLLDFFCRFSTLCSCYHSCWNITAYFFCMTWT